MRKIQVKTRARPKTQIGPLQSPRSPLWCFILCMYVACSHIHKMSSLLILEFRDWRCFAAVIVAGHGVQAGGACAPASRDHDCCCRLWWQSRCGCVFAVIFALCLPCRALLCPVPPSACVCVCVYIYIYTHIHIHKHTRTHTHTTHTHICMMPLFGFVGVCARWCVCVGR